MEAKYVKYGKLEVLESEIKDITFEEAKEKFPHVKESLLKGAWNEVNPKGKLKKAKSNEEN